MRLRGDLRIEDNLRQSIPIAEIDEDQPAEIATAIDPPGQGDLFAGVASAQGSTGQFSGDRGIDVIL